MIRAVALCAVLSCAATASAADFFRIASFNIEHLGTRTPPQRPIALAEHIDLSGAIVVALQEIGVSTTIADNPATPFDESRRNDVLDTAFAILNQEGDAQWTYELFPNRVASDTTQLCGVAWDAKVVERDGAALPLAITGMNAASIWDRRPHAVKFRYPGKTDIVLIPVHMKSNFDGVAIGRTKRLQEAESLVAGLPAVQTHFAGEKDIIILGDTNILDASEAAAEKITDAGFRDTNTLDVATYIGSGNGSPFDRFFVATADEAEEFAFARQYVLQATEPAAHDNFLSDHQMVLLSFRVKMDDD